MGARVEPCIAPLHDLHIELPPLQIGLVDGSDFQFAPGAGPDRLGNLDDLLVVEIQARHRIAALGLAGLFFDADRAALRIELHHSIALRVLDMVGEDRRPLRLGIGRAQEGDEVVTVEQVVAQHQGTGRAADEALTDQERLRQPVRAGLHGVLDLHAPLAAVTEQLLESRRVLGRADDEHITQARQHERAQRVVHHRLVVHRQQLLADGQRGRMQTGARTSGEHDAFARWFHARTQAGG